MVDREMQLSRMEQRRRTIERGIEQYYRSRSQKEQREDRGWTRLAGRYTQRLWDD